MNIRIRQVSDKPQYVYQEFVVELDGQHITRFFHNPGGTPNVEDCLRDAVIALEVSHYDDERLDRAALDQSRTQQGEDVG